MSKQPPMPGTFKVEIEIPGDEITQLSVEMLINEVISKTGKADFSALGQKVANRIKVLSRYLRVAKALDLD